MNPTQHSTTQAAGHMCHLKNENLQARRPLTTPDFQAAFLYMPPPGPEA